MIERIPANRLMLAAAILIAAMALQIAAGIAAFYQTEYQLTNPLIPRETIGGIARPALRNALVLSLAMIPCILFYFLRKPIAVLAVGGLALIFVQVAGHFGLFL